MVLSYHTSAMSTPSYELIDMTDRLPRQGAFRWYVCVTGRGYYTILYSRYMRLYDCRVAFNSPSGANAHVKVCEDSTLESLLAKIHSSCENNPDRSMDAAEADRLTDVYVKTYSRVIEQANDRTDRRIAAIGGVGYAARRDKNGKWITIIGGQDESKPRTRTSRQSRAGAHPNARRAGERKDENAH